LPDQADFDAAGSSLRADHVAASGFGSDSPGTSLLETARKRPESPVCRIRRDNEPNIGHHCHGPQKASFADPHGRDTSPTIDHPRQAGHFPAGREIVARGRLRR